MRNILAIVERELRAYFNSPIAYVVLTIFVFLSGLFFRSILAQVMQMALISGSCICGYGEKSGCKYRYQYEGTTSGQYG